MTIEDHLTLTTLCRTMVKEFVAEELNLMQKSNSYDGIIYTPIWGICQPILANDIFARKHTKEANLHIMREHVRKISKQEDKQHQWVRFENFYLKILQTLDLEYVEQQRIICCKLLDCILILDHDFLSAYGRSNRKDKWDYLHDCYQLFHYEAPWLWLSSHLADVFAQEMKARPELARYVI